MSDDGSARSSTGWPLPKFHFEAEWDAAVLSFEEVSGLDLEAGPIEYRAGDSPLFSTVDVPGVRTAGTVTMKKGVFTSDIGFREWLGRIQANATARQSVTIRLLDEAGRPTMVWTLANACPTKISGTDLDSQGNEVAIESIEVVHEGLTIASG